jgi:hypothetical protein
MAVINSTDLMHKTFVHCRAQSPSAGESLRSLRPVLNRVRQSKALDVTVEEAWLAEVFGDEGRWVRGYGAVHPTDLTEINAQNERYFELIDVGVTALTALCAQGSWKAVGHIGYALHNVPRLLRQPGGFSRIDFGFSFRIASHDWKVLPGDLQLALCELMDIDVDRAAQLIGTEGFVLGGTPDRSRPINELEIVPNWNFPRHPEK